MGFQRHSGRRRLNMTHLCLRPYQYSRTGRGGTDAIPSDPSTEYRANTVPGHLIAGWPSDSEKSNDTMTAVRSFLVPPISANPRYEQEA